MRRLVLALVSLFAMATAVTAQTVTLAADLKQVAFGAPVMRLTAVDDDANPTTRAWLAELFTGENPLFRLAVLMPNGAVCLEDAFDPREDLGDDWNAVYSTTDIAWTGTRHILTVSAATPFIGDTQPYREIRLDRTKCR